MTETEEYDREGIRGVVQTKSQADEGSGDGDMVVSRGRLVVMEGDSHHQKLLREVE